MHNKSGLHRKYIIKKSDGSLVDPDAEYFVLRLDVNGKDEKHTKACRKALMLYAEEIKDHLPVLSKDLIDRYGD